ncbi:Uncharacterised protein [Bordetella pertussis]|nr:Uncharacterised protein [Bordetella pertussis]
MNCVNSAGLEDGGGSAPAFSRRKRTVSSLALIFRMALLTTVTTSSGMPAGPTMPSQE